MARLIAALIRHGKYHQPDNVPSAMLPYPLTDDGSREIRGCSKELFDFSAGQGWATAAEIDSSRMQRAYQTAHLIKTAGEEAGQSRFKVRQYDALAERGLGAASNLTVSEIEKIISDDLRFEALPKNWKSQSDFRLPLQGAESLMMAGRRVAGHISRKMKMLRAELERDTLKIFVGHGAAFRHAAVVLGIMNREQAMACSMYHGKPVFLEMLGDGSWQHIAGEWRPRTAAKSSPD